MVEGSGLGHWFELQGGGGLLGRAREECFAEEVPLQDHLKQGVVARSQKAEAVVSGAFWKGDLVLLMVLMSWVCVRGLNFPDGRISLGHQGSASCRDPLVPQCREQPSWEEPFWGSWTCLPVRQSHVRAEHV